MFTMSPTKEKSTTPTLENISVIDKIFKPANDCRTYRGFQLANGLNVLLISDVELETSATALTVNVGSLSDPQNCQGLAHLVERMTLIASRKYPEVHGFKKFLEANGGAIGNATSMTRTQFIFEVNSSVLDKSLDMFVHSFINPALPESELSKEVDAIQNGFIKLKQTESYRIFRVRQLLSEPGHEFRQFSHGNRKTLLPDGDIKNLHRNVVRFARTNYSSHMMSLAVIGPQSLEELQRLVLDRFSKLVKFNVIPLRIEKHPFPPERCLQLVQIVPATETRKLVMFFPLPARISGNATSYVQHILQHQGAGSLFSQLKKYGYSTLIRVSINYYCGFGFFDIEVDLTQGITRNKEIFELVHQFLHLLRNYTPPKRIYNELKALHSMSFIYMEPQCPWDLVRSASSNILYGVQETAICGQPYGEFNPTDIRAVMDCLKPSRFNVLVISPVFKNILTDAKYDDLLDIFYSPNKFQSFDLGKTLWDDLDFNSDFELPEENQYIPSNFQLIAGSNQQVPECIVSEKLEFKIWYLQHSQIPKASYRFYVRSPFIYTSPENESAVEVYLRIFREHILQKFYSVFLCECSISVWMTKFGVEIKLHGFNDKLDMIALQVLAEFLKFEVPKERFEIVRDVYMNELRTFNERPMYYVLTNTLRVIQTPGQHEPVQCFKALGELKRINQLYEIVSKVFSHFQVECSVIGNVSTESVHLLASNLEEMIQIFFGKNFLKNAPKCEPPQDFYLPTPSFFEMSHRDDFHNNNGVLFYYQIGREDNSLRYVQFLLFHRIVKSHFHQVAMKEAKLGCDVAFALRETWTGTFGLEVIVETEKSLPVVLQQIETLMSSTLENFLKDKVSAEDFKKHKHNLNLQLRQYNKRIAEITYTLAREIGSQKHIWDWNEKLLADLNRITSIDDIMAFYKTYIHIHGECVRRIVLKLRSTKRDNNIEPTEPTLLRANVPLKYEANIAKFRVDLRVLNEEDLN